LGLFGYKSGTSNPDVCNYITPTTRVYSRNCTTIGSGCELRFNSCNTIANEYCFTNNGSSYWCTDGNGIVTSTGACTEGLP
jgi:hypothetical protein